MHKNIQIGLSIFLLFLLDQGTKYLFYTLRWGEELPLLHPLLNTGISRGIAVPSSIVISLSLLGIGFFFYLRKEKVLSATSFILLLAGTLGNLFDRILLGGVRDFIALGSFPVFNIADILLSIAVAVLLFDEIFPCNSSRKP